MTGHTLFRGTESKLCDHCGATFFRDKRNTWKHWRAARFCSRPCSARHQAAVAAAERGDMGTEFLRWFEKSDGCWQWLGAIDRDGYGIFSYAKRTHRAARIALLLDGRPPSANQYACHHCDNPRCVRPDHLYPGTPTQNVNDMLSRGRYRSGRKAKLNPEKVRLIRSDKRPHPVVAADYGVSVSLISMVQRRAIWKNVV